MQRETAVRNLVRQLRETFGWYDALLRDSSYDSQGDLSALPLIDERILERHYYCDRAPVSADVLEYLTSGTSTGVRKRVRYSAIDHEDYISQRKLILRQFLPTGLKTACADLGTGHAAASAMRIFRELGLEAEDIPFSLPLAEHVARMNSRQPEVVFTMPVLLDRLLSSEQLRIAPRRVIVLGDVATPAWKLQVRNRLGLPSDGLLDLVGSIEVGAIAHECHACGLYHFGDHILPEGIPMDAAPGATDQILVVTSLSRRAFPGLRFVTGDIVRGLQEHLCRGVQRWSFEALLGRSHNEYKHGEKISAFEITEAVNRVLPGTPFSVSDTTGLQIRVGVNRLDEADAVRIVAHLRAGNPPLDQLLESGLVPPISVVACSGELEHRGAKRSLSGRMG